MTRESNDMEIKESYQRYVDEIYMIARKKRGGWVTNKEISESLKVEPASVSGMLEKLKKAGLVNWEPRKSIRLSEKGRKIAMQLNEIHSLLFTFFKKVLKVEDDALIDKISCEVEHHITKEVKNSLSNFLDDYLE